MTDFLTNTSKVWTWLWRSFTLTLGSNIIFSSSKVSCSQTLRFVYFSNQCWSLSCCGDFLGFTVSNILWGGSVCKRMLWFYYIKLSKADNPVFFLFSSLVIMWNSSTTTFTLKPQRVKKEQSTPQDVSSGTTEWVCSGAEQNWKMWILWVNACSNMSLFCLCAAADRLWSLLQNLHRKHWTGAKTVHSLRPQDRSHRSKFAHFHHDKTTKQTFAKGSKQFFFYSVFQIIKEARVKHCNKMNYNRGAMTLLTVVGENWTLWLTWSSMWLHFVSF